MGDPRRLRKKYKKPKKLWDKLRIDEESKLRKFYGLKNTRELWIAQEELRRVRRKAREALALPPEEREKVAKSILMKLERLDILPSTATIDDILSLNVKDFLERRLQTIVWRKGLAKTIKQARQLIVHGFIAVDGRKVTSPGFIVKKNLNDKIGYYKKINLEQQNAENQEINEENKEGKVKAQADNAA